MKRVAVLDLGTNTFHLLIADISKAETPVLVYQETIAVKLGEGGINQGFINQDAFERGMEAIKRFKEKILSFAANEVRSAATSAIRSASNGADFIEKIKQETEIDLDVIDGDLEAELIYRGVRAAVSIDQNCLIVDIGGGSVEFIICNASEILWKKSYPIGAARLMDKFHRSDPISEDEILGLNNYLDQTLQDLKSQLNICKPVLMIGSAGAFETFALLENPGYHTNFENPELTIDLRKLKATTEMITKSTHNERLANSGIAPVRKDMIVVASLLTQYIIQASGIKHLKLSGYSLKEGLLYKSIEEL